MKKYVSIFLVLVLLFSLSVSEMLADNTVPRLNLAVEYLFNWSAIDTSGNSNSVQWIGDSYKYDWSWAINYASFSWTSQVGWLLWWWTDWFWSYTMSFRLRLSDLNWGSTSCPRWYTYNGTTCHKYNQTSWFWDTTQPVWKYILWTQRINWPTTDIGLYMTSNQTCYFESAVNWFDCTIFRDLKWHNMVLRKDDYQSLTVFIDNKIVALIRSDARTFGRTVLIWKNPLNTADPVWLVWGVWAFRIYKYWLSDSDVTNLYNEYPLLLPPVNSATPIITINNPNTNSEPSKNLSASTNTWTLQMSITKWDICNAALIFDDYSNMSFSAVSDNWTKVCYKATNAWITTYKMSDKLTWITSQSTTFTPESIFDENAYKSWPSSWRVRQNDFTYSILWAMTGKDGSNYINFIDVNWDWLVDVMYNYSSYRAILSNSWDYNFKVSYKCKISWSVYYWDCADLNYK